MDTKLKDQQIAFLLFSAIVGYGIVSLPKDVAEKAGTAGWISILISTVLALLVTYTIIYLGYVFDGKTLFEYSQILVGKFLTYFFSILYIVFYFSFFTLITRIASEVIRLNILLRTPAIAVSFFFLLVLYYAVTKGFATIARFSQLAGIIVVVFLSFILIMISTEGKMVNIRPFLGEQDILVYLNGMKSTIVAFLGMSILTIVPIRRNHNKQVFKYATVTIGIIGFLYILIVESCISVIGVEDIVHYKDALIATMRRIEIPYLQFLERIDAIVLSIWMISVITTIIILGYGCTFYTSRILKIPNSKLITLIISILALVISQLPKTCDSICIILDYVAYFGLCLLAIPMILLIVTLVKGYHKGIK